MDDKQGQIARYTKEMQKQIRKQRLRDARRKSGDKDKTKKPRQKDWVPDSRDGWEDLDYSSEERIMPRGDAERRSDVERRSDTERHAFEGRSDGNTEGGADPQNVDSAHLPRAGTFNKIGCAACATQPIFRETHISCS